MPTYEYLCSDCGASFEKFQRMSANKVRTCPECRGKNLKRLIGSGSGIIFKGSGFYCNDYGNKNPESNTSEFSESGEGKDKPTLDKPLS